MCLLHILLVHSRSRYLSKPLYILPTNVPFKPNIQCAHTILHPVSVAKFCPTWKKLGHFVVSQYYRSQNIVFLSLFGRFVTFFSPLSSIMLTAVFIYLPHSITRVRFSFTTIMLCLSVGITSSFFRKSFHYCFFLYTDCNRRNIDRIRRCLCFKLHTQASKKYSLFLKP